MRDKNLRDVILKHFYGIVGGLDEYKRQETNRIGNNLMILSFFFILIAALVAGFFAINHPIQAVWGLITANIAFVTLVMCPYIAISVRRNKIDDIEISQSNLRQVCFRLLRHSILSGLFFGTVMYLTNSFTAYLYGSKELSKYLLSLSMIRSSVLLGLYGTVCAAAYGLYRIKKYKE